MRTDDLESVRVERGIKRVRSDLAAHLKRPSVDIPGPRSISTSLSKDEGPMTEATGEPVRDHDWTSSPQTQKLQSCLGEARIFVTADSGIFKVVDITGAREGAFIRERIFADVRVYYSCCQDVLVN